jgi:hypothetical protein
MSSYKIGQSVIVRNGVSKMVVKLEGIVSTASIKGYYGTQYYRVQGKLVETDISWIPETLILGVSDITAQEAASNL